MLDRLNFIATLRPKEWYRRELEGKEPLPPEPHPQLGEAELRPAKAAPIIHKPVVSSLLSCADIIALLVERGCKNLTSDLNTSLCSIYPVFGGGFGDVYSGQLNDGTQVAIKAIRRYDSKDHPVGKYDKRAARELHTWSKCDHQNVLKLLGLAEFQGRLAMISPWAENGSLPVYLKRNLLVNRCSLSTSICDGLAYLHQTGIVHGDLKGANILVTSTGTPVLTDFGNATQDDSSVSFTTTAGTGLSLRWAAPEILESRPHSRAGDVYALGMTILETITGEVPFSQIHDSHIFRTVIDKKEAPPRPEDSIPTPSVCGNLLWVLLMSCWAYEPELRPSAIQVGAVMRIITPESLTSVQPCNKDGPHQQNPPGPVINHEPDELTALNRSSEGS